jgi:hypothetical protein
MPSTPDELREIFKSGLVKDPGVWRNDLLVPGPWTEPSDDEIADVLIRLSHDHDAKGRLPLPLVFRVLAAKRLRLEWTPFDLWAFALNVDFDVGILDVLTSRTHDGGAAPVLVAEFLPGVFESLAEDTKTPFPDVSPSTVCSKLKSADFALSATSAIECAMLCLALSRREKGRLRVLEEGAACRIADGVSTVDVTVAYSGGAYRVTASISGDRLRVERVQRAASIEPVPPELLVGPVRISNLERPARHAR